MAEPPSPTTVIETLRSIGLSDAEIACQELDQGWRIRAQGGLIVYMRKDGPMRNEPISMAAMLLCAIISNSIAQSGAVLSHQRFPLKVPRQCR